MSIESAPLPHLLEVLFNARFIAERLGEEAFDADQRSFAESVADDIGILIRKTWRELMRE